MKDYKFVTIWRVKAPLESVWNEIYHAKEWPTWWKGVENVVELRRGDEKASARFIATRGRASFLTG